MWVKSPERAENTLTDCGSACTHRPSITGGRATMRTIMTMSATGLALSVAAAPAFATAVNYPAQQSTITYSQTSTATSLFGNYARATSKVVYDPATGTYTLRDTGSLAITSSFGPSNINSGASNA